MSCVSLQTAACSSKLMWLSTMVSPQHYQTPYTSLTPRVTDLTHGLSHIPSGLSSFLAFHSSPLYATSLPHPTVCPRLPKGTPSWEVSTTVPSSSTQFRLSEQQTQDLLGSTAPQGTKDPKELRKGLKKWNPSPPCSFPPKTYLCVVFPPPQPSLGNQDPRGHTTILWHPSHPSRGSPHLPTRPRPAPSHFQAQTPEALPPPSPGSPRPPARPRATPSP